MVDEKISIDAVKTLIAETVKQTTEAQSARQDAHEARTEAQMSAMTEAIKDMSQTLGRSVDKVTDGLAETNKQLAENNAQFVKWEERHYNNSEEMKKLDKKQEKQGQELRELKEDQIADTLTRKVTWKVGTIVLTAVLGGAFTFAWWLAKTITSALITAAQTGATP